MNSIEENKPIANREYKSSVFALLFKDIVGRLYYAITGKPISPGAKISITTLTDVLYKGRLNDLSFEIDGKLIVVIEHQSTLNPNMPLRMQQYYTMLGKRYDSVQKAIYSETLVKIPRPEFIVLYNGVDPMPGGDRYTLRLSDMFIEQSDEPMGGMELTVEVFNINKGYNTEMAARCKELADYETFIHAARENERSGMSREDAVKKAVFDCIEHGTLKEFLETYKWEVVDMLVTEWDYELEKKILHEDGRLKGKTDVARKLLSMNMEVNDVVAATGLDLNDVLKLKGEM